MKYKKIMLAMAEEISRLRIDNDLEWGEYAGDYSEYYNPEKIVEEYIKEEGE
jgi:hypothetical protein